MLGFILLFILFIFLNASNSNEYTEGCQDPVLEYLLENRRNVCSTQFCLIKDRDVSTSADYKSITSLHALSEIMTASFAGSVLSLCEGSNVMTHNSREDGELQNGEAIVVTLIANRVL